MYNSTIAIKQDKFKKEDFIIIRISKKRLGNRVWLHPKWWQQVGQKVHRGVTDEDREKLAKQNASNEKFATAERRKLTGL